MAGEAAPGEPLTDTGDDRSERTYTTLGTVLLIALVVIVILLFWRTCGASTETSRSNGEGGVITDVAPLETVEGALAVWLRPQATIEAVLERNGLGGSDAVSLGDGTYVITVSDDIESVIEDLKNDPDLFDAGYLYAEE